MPETRSNVPVPVVAAAGWVVPGLGYWLVGERARGVIVFVTVLAMFLGGVLIAGIRVIDVPGYDEDGQPVLVAVRGDAAGNAVEYRTGQPGTHWVTTDPGAKWIMRVHPLGELLNKPWYIGQVLVGPITLIGSKYSIDLSKPLGPDTDVAGAPKSHVRVAEIGTLYTAVAGMLNLLVIIDAAHRANRKAGATS
jgi:hypothetical protein